MNQCKNEIENKKFKLKTGCKARLMELISEEGDHSKSPDCLNKRNWEGDIPYFFLNALLK